MILTNGSFSVELGQNFNLVSATIDIALDYSATLAYQNVSSSSN